MKLILPTRGEFGLKLAYAIPAVHALPGPKIVLHEPGEECLYPSADRLVEVPRAHDDNKRGLQAKDRGSAEAEAVHDVIRRVRTEYPDAEVVEPGGDMPAARFVPEPTVRRGITCDVVVCPRKRDYGADKNWPEWELVTRRLRSRGYRVFAGGMESTSYPVGSPAAWDHERELDATVEAMLSCKLVLATDAGLAHLAVLCGAPLLMVTHGAGLVAPGPVRDATGRVMEPAYWPVKIERYNEANHTGSKIELLHHAWFNPALVIRRVLEIVADHTTADLTPSGNAPSYFGAA